MALTFLKNRISHSLVLTLTIAWASLAFANVPVKFGPEFTFYNSKFSKNEEIKAALEDYKAHLISHLIDNQIGKAKFNFNVTWDTFTSPNGWHFTPSTDAGVIEVTTKPMTLEEWEMYAADIQDAIFVSAYNLNLWPALYLGGGHINIGIEAFYKNPILLRNFIVDFWNHNELALGILNYDTNNAASLSMLNDSTIQEVAQWLESFDQFLLGNKNRHTRKKIIEQLDALSSITFSATSWMGRAWRGDSQMFKYTELNFSSVVHQRFEIRSIRAQQNMTTWLNQIKLIQGRINYLEKMGTELIPLRFKLTVQKPVTQQQKKLFKLTPPVKANEAIQLFYTYVKESGQSWSDHRDYIWPKWIKNGALKKFEKSKWFLAQEKNCGAML